MQVNTFSSLLITFTSFVLILSGCGNSSGKNNPATETSAAEVAAQSLAEAEPTPGFDQLKTDEKYIALKMATGKIFNGITKEKDSDLDRVLALLDRLREHIKKDQYLISTINVNQSGFFSRRADEKYQNIDIKLSTQMTNQEIKTYLFAHAQEEVSIKQKIKEELEPYVGKYSVYFLGSQKVSQLRSILRNIQGLPSVLGASSFRGVDKTTPKIKIGDYTGQNEYRLTLESMEIHSGMNSATIAQSMTDWVKIRSDYDALDIHKLRNSNYQKRFEVDSLDERNWKSVKEWNSFLDGLDQIDEVVTTQMELIQREVPNIKFAQVSVSNSAPSLIQPSEFEYGQTVNYNKMIGYRDELYQALGTTYDPLEVQVRINWNDFAQYPAQAGIQLEAKFEDLLQNAKANLELRRAREKYADLQKSLAETIDLNVARTWLSSAIRASWDDSSFPEKLDDRRRVTGAIESAINFLNLYAERIGKARAKIGRDSFYSSKFIAFKLEGTLSFEVFFDLSEGQIIDLSMNAEDEMRQYEDYAERFK